METNVCEIRGWEGLDTVWGGLILHCVVDNEAGGRLCLKKSI